MRNVTLSGSQIKITFPFNLDLLEVARNLPDRLFYKDDKSWRVPATPFHAKAVVSALSGFGFDVSDGVSAMARARSSERKLDLPEALYDFQKTGVKFLVQANGRGILADQMGLGKTPQALVFVDYFCSKTLVVAPANVTYKWLGEAGKWTKKSADIVLTSKQPLPTADIHIMSYDIMRIRHEELIKQQYDCIIFDESHRLANYKSQRTRAARKLAGARRLLMLSGTPILNRPSDLFPMLNMISPINFPNFFSFAKRYAGAYFDGSYWVFPNQATNPSELAERLKGVMIRRTKSEVLTQLPDKSRTIVPVRLENEKEYREEKNEFARWRYENPGASHGDTLVHLTALRKIVGLSKVAAAVDLAEEVIASDGKVVLYAHHLDVVRGLQDGLSSYKRLVIAGSTSAKERAEVVRAFQEGDLEVVIMTSAGAEGIDLFAASHIIFCEREWTPAAEEQAEDRLHRIGQKNAVNCWYLSVLGTMDEKMAKLVQSKRDVIGSVISQSEVLTSILEEL